MALATKTVLKPYIALHVAKVQHETKLADIKEKMAAMQETIIESFGEDGIQSVNCNGFTVHLKRNLYASAGGDPPDRVAMIEAIKAMPDKTWSFLVGDNVNANMLSSRVRECEVDGNDMPILPDELKKLIKVAEVFKIGMRKTK